MHSEEGWLNDFGSWFIAVRDYEIADLGSRHQEAVVAHLMDFRRRHQGHQAGDEIEWCQDLMAGAVAPRPGESQPNAAVVELFESVMRKRRFEYVVAEPLESFSILLGHSARCMKIKSMRGTLPTSRCMVLVAGHDAELQHPLAGLVAEQRGALDRCRGTV